MRNTVIVCAAGLALAAGGCRKAEKQAEPLDVRPLVKVGRVSPDCEFTDGVRVQGSVRAKFSAAVSARVPGAIDSVEADEGQTVKAGAPLFQIDKVNLENRLRLAQDDLNVARAGCREAEAAQAEAQAAYDKAKIDAGRMKSLYEQDQAVTKDSFEKAELQFKSADAAMRRVLAAVETAKTRIVQAETALSVARKNLEDSRGVAPFDGIITRKLRDRGDFVDAGTPVFAMDDPRVYEVCFSMNAEHYDRVETGKTRVRLDDGRELPVSYKSPSVHPVARTFEIRAVVERTPDLAPGMIRDARVVFRQYRAAAVPSQAVGLRGGKHVVFVVREGVVAAVDVETGLEWQGLTEIKNAEQLKGAEIVTEGMLLLNAGDRVRVERAQ